MNHISLEFWVINFVNLWMGSLWIQLLLLEFRRGIDKVMTFWLGQTPSVVIFSYFSISSSFCFYIPPNRSTNKKKPLFGASSAIFLSVWDKNPCKAVHSTSIIQSVPPEIYICKVLKIRLYAEVNETGYNWNSYLLVDFKLNTLYILFGSLPRL